MTESLPQSSMHCWPSFRHQNSLDGQILSSWDELPKRNVRPAAPSARAQDADEAGVCLGGCSSELKWEHATKLVPQESGPNVAESAHLAWPAPYLHNTAQFCPCGSVQLYHCSISVNCNQSPDAGFMFNIMKLIISPRIHHLDGEN